MLLLFIQCSTCKYTIDLLGTKIGKGKYLTLFIEPFDEVDVKINKTYWTLLSEWKYANKLNLDVLISKSGNKELEFGPYKSSSKLIALYSDTANYTLKFTSDSADEQIFGLIILPRFVNGFKLSDVYTPQNFNYPFITRYSSENGEIPSDSFIYDADVKEGIMSYILMGILFVIFIMLWAISDRKYIQRSYIGTCCPSKLPLLDELENY